MGTRIGVAIVADTSTSTGTGTGTHAGGAGTGGSGTSGGGVALVWTDGGALTRILSHTLLFYQ